MSLKQVSEISLMSCTECSKQRLKQDVLANTTKQKGLKGRLKTCIYLERGKERERERDRETNGRIEGRTDGQTDRQRHISANRRACSSSATHCTYEELTDQERISNSCATAKRQNLFFDVQLL